MATSFTHHGFDCTHGGLGPSGSSLLQKSHDDDGGQQDNHEGPELAQEGDGQHLHKVPKKHVEEGARGRRAGRRGANSASAACRTQSVGTISV